MANDGELIIPDDDEPNDTWGELLRPAEESEEKYGGVQEAIRRGYDTTDYSFSNTSRCFTKIDKGVLTFGDRNKNTGAITTRHTLNPIYKRGYYGIACDVKKLDIYCFASGDSEIALRFGSYYGATGYLQVITDVRIDTLVHWTIERLPFKNGICIAKR